jgi:hypothetical protein
MLSVKTEARHLMCERTHGIWVFEVTDVMTYSVWNGATVALFANVTDQAESIVVPISELLASLRMFNVCDGTKS